MLERSPWALCVEGHKSRGRRRPFLRQRPQLLVQFIAVAVVTAYSLVATYAIIKVVNVLVKVRVPDRRNS